MITLIAFNSAPPAFIDQPTLYMHMIELLLCDRFEMAACNNPCHVVLFCFFLFLPGVHYAQVASIPQMIGVRTRHWEMLACQAKAESSLC